MVRDATCSGSTTRYSVPSAYVRGRPWSTTSRTTGGSARARPHTCGARGGSGGPSRETATTVVCSQVLAERWRARYGVALRLVQNGVDLAGHEAATPRKSAGGGPHMVYVGTLHAERLDVALLLRLARAMPGGQ